MSLPTGSPRTSAAAGRRQWQPADARPFHEACAVDRLLASGMDFVVCFCGRRLVFSYCDECGYEAPVRRAHREQLERDEAARQAVARAQAHRRRAWGRSKAARRRRYLTGR